jgi:hypothetical protein
MREGLLAEEFNGRNTIVLDDDPSPVDQSTRDRIMIRAVYGMVLIRKVILFDNFLF